uniref:chromate efflux transporter n=1 Tax=Aliarcobacter sp. TaxID=2321116 RepID=UPI0040474110
MYKIFEIFYRFLLLGLVSFGGPVAHIAYFKNTFVDKLKWLDEQSYTKIVALSQFLPGPSSSQVGFTIGLKQGGIIGAIFAFIGFTLPSFFILYFLSISQIFQTQNIYIIALITALKLIAIVVVLDAIYSMFNSFCKDKVSIFIFILSVFILLFISGAFTQILTLVISGILGFIFAKNSDEVQKQKIKYPNIFLLILFFILLFILPFASSRHELIDLFTKFYEAGSLVFGGGHVVLPLLQEKVVNEVSTDTFLLAYSLAQMVPGPMFTIATYLGAEIYLSNALLGAFIATLAIFLPGFLLILAFYKSFETISSKRNIKNILSGVNASVVGLLLATMISTLLPSAVHNIFDVILVIIGFCLQRFMKINFLYIIVLFIGICILGEKYV